MLSAADSLVPFHTYPHTDQAQTGRRAATVLLRLVAGRARPVTALVRLPMLVRGDELLTATGLLGHAMRGCQETERRRSGLAAGVLIGNPYTDVPDLASNVLVTTDGDHRLAASTAESVATMLWERRHDLQATTVPLDEAVAAAADRPGLTAFSDAADATSSGAPGDSNAILRALLDAKWPKRALIAIVDPPAAEAAAAAGPGVQITVTLGGRLDPSTHHPLPVTATVLRVSTADVRYEDGTLGKVGTAAVMRIGAIDVLVTARRLWVVGRAVFTAHGLEPLDYDLVALKSPNGFRAHYESAAAAIVPVDTPGCTSLSLTRLAYRHLGRPMFPWDDPQPDLKATLH
jgi:microcystin degradation protein MlrC